MTIRIEKNLYKARKPRALCKFYDNAGLGRHAYIAFPSEKSALNFERKYANWGGFLRLMMDIEKVTDLIPDRYDFGTAGIETFRVVYARLYPGAK